MFQKFKDRLIARLKAKKIPMIELELFIQSYEEKRKHFAWKNGPWEELHIDDLAYIVK